MDICNSSLNIRDVSGDNLTHSNSLLSTVYPLFDSAANSVSCNILTPSTDTCCNPPIGALHAVHTDFSMGFVQFPTEYLCPFGHTYHPTNPDALTISVNSSSGNPSK